MEVAEGSRSPRGLYLPSLRAHPSPPDPFTNDPSLIEEGTRVFPVEEECIVGNLVRESHGERTIRSGEKRKVL